MGIYLPKITKEIWVIKRDIAAMPVVDCLAFTKFFDLGSKWLIRHYYYYIFTKLFNYSNFGDSVGNSFYLDI